MTNEQKVEMIKKVENTVKEKDTTYAKACVSLGINPKQFNDCKYHMKKKGLLSSSEIGRQTRPIEEKMAIVEKVKQGIKEGKTTKISAKENGITDATFYKWRRALKRNNRKRKVSVSEPTFQTFKIESTPERTVTIIHGLPVDRCVEILDRLGIRG